MRELALQSSNGTLTLANRSALQLEFDANINQINHVLITTNFNGIKLGADIDSRKRLFMSDG